MLIAIFAITSISIIRSVGRENSKHHGWLQLRFKGYVFLGFSCILKDGDSL